jgi:peptidoglycan/LPS O-acetylase OafA/YrhL
MTPLVVMIHGYFWVIVFFILSGFVLPLSYFKTGKLSSIYGGSLRRYPRLMLPVLFTLTLYYLVVKFGVTYKYAFPAVKRKNFGLLLLDGLVGTWLGNNDYTVVTWTLSIELWASFLIYILALVTINYRWRYMIYFFIFVFIWTAVITDAYKYTDYGVGNGKSRFVACIPMFFIGTLICDSEQMFKTWRPLDYVRRWGLCLSILRNIVLLFLFFSYGSYIGKDACHAVREGNCIYWQVVTINWLLPKEFCNYIGALAIILLGLTSEGTQWFLLTPPI